MRGRKSRTVLHAPLSQGYSPGGQGGWTTTVRLTDAVPHALFRTCARSTTHSRLGGPADGGQAGKGAWTTTVRSADAAPQLRKQHIRRSATFRELVSVVLRALLW